MAKKKNDLAFAPNFTQLHMINLTPGAAIPKWGYIGGGIQTVGKANSETVANDSYYDGGGQASSDVTGSQMTISFSGHRKYGDAVQDYLASLEYVYGEARKTDYRHIAPDGSITDANVTIANVVNGGGDANAKGTFSFDLQFNGTPTLIPGDKTNMPESIVVTPVTVAVGETAKIEVTVDPVTASNGCMFGVEDDEIAFVGADGTVKGLAPGTTLVTVKSALKPALVAQVVITVDGEATNPLPTVAASGYAKDKATGDSVLNVTDCVDQTFYVKFTKPLGDYDYLVVQEYLGKKYGIIVDATKHPEWTKIYWTLADGRQVDFVDGAKKANNAAAKVDLTSFSGTIPTTIYRLAEPWDGTKYPTDLEVVDTLSIQVSNA